jgi:hypothetical protein
MATLIFKDITLEKKKKWIFWMSENLNESVGFVQ